jgi:aryl-alcohol dehydrogenase-like predicted oxidoreductase
MDRFVEAGGNFIDTADVYSGANPKRLSATGSRPSLATKW